MHSPIVFLLLYNALNSSFETKLLQYFQASVRICHLVAVFFAKVHGSNADVRKCSLDRKQIYAQGGS